MAVEFMEPSHISPIVQFLVTISGLIVDPKESETNS